MSRLFFTLFCCMIIGVKAAELKFDASEVDSPWRIQNGVSTKDHDDAFVRLTTSTEENKNARLQSPAQRLSPGSTLIIRCTYRTTVENSGLHNGAWLAILPHGENLRADGIAFIPSAEWRTISKVYTIPEATRSIEFQARLQQRIGQLDIKSLSIAPLVSGVVISELDLTAGASDWTLSNTNILSSPLGEKYVRLALAENAGVARASYMDKVIPGKNLELSLTYQTDVTNSRSDYGAWIYVAWMDKSGKVISRQDFPLARAVSWLERKISLDSVENADRLTIQIRLQQTIGFLDLKNVRLSVAPEKKVESAENVYSSYISNLELVGKYKLEKTPSGITLVDSLNNHTLTSLQKTMPASFILPEEFTGKDFTYVLSVSFIPQLSSREDNHTQGLFTLGRNMSGTLESDSFSVNIWRGKALYTRLTSTNTGSRAEARDLKISLMAGETHNVTSVFSSQSLASFLDGKIIGTPTTASTSFSWPVNREFWLGCEDVNASVFKGEITDFSLKIYRPWFKLSWEDSPAPGYFRGSGRHRQIVKIEGKLPENTLISASIMDVDGKKLEVTPKISQDLNLINLDIPSLPQGWYNMECTFRFNGQKSRHNMKFVILPSETNRDTIAESPFGATQTFALSPDRYTKKYFERMIPLVAKSGIRWFRVWLHWSQVQDENRKYHWEGLDHIISILRNNGIEPMICLLGGRHPYQTKVKSPWHVHDGYYPPLEEWSRFLKTVAERYKGKVSYYQIWNEPDTKCNFYPFEPEAYYELLKNSYITLKTVNQEIKVTNGGFCVALQGKNLEKYSHTQEDSNWGAPAFYRLNPQKYFDITSVHLYSVNTYDQSWEPQKNDVIAMRKFLEQFGENEKPLWNTETSFLSGTPGTRGGWASNHLISIKDHAARLIQWYIQSLAVGIERNFWYIFSGEEPGIVNSDLSPKPAFVAQANLVNMLNGMKYSEMIPAGVNVRIYKFSGKKGKMACAWTLNGKELLALSAKDSPVIISDCWGNIIEKLEPSSLKLLEVGIIPLYISSSSDFSVRQVFTLEPDGIQRKGQSANLIFSVTNPTAQAVSVLLRITDGVNFLLDKNINVPANSTINQPVSISTVKDSVQYGVVLSGGINRAFSTNLTLNWKMGLELSGSKTVYGEIKHADQEVVGGKFIDSQGRLLRESLRKSDQDLSAVFSLRRSGRQVSFNIDVNDDIVIAAPQGKERAMYEYDCVELFLDLDGTLYQILISPDGESVRTGGKLPEGFQASAKKKNGGYIVSGDFNIPENVKDSFGFDIAIDDTDDEHKRKCQMVWAGDEHNYRSFENYGRIILKP
ncbi:MAG: cellulase family glycosylhydrolase [Victivallales bacterium]|nr:cellulase family glycosylhydrolase [Victivallales bacterium]